MKVTPSAASIKLLTVSALAVNHLVKAGMAPAPNPDGVIPSGFRNMLDACTITLFEGSELFAEDYRAIWQGLTAGDCKMSFLDNASKPCVYAEIECAGAISRGSELCNGKIYNMDNGDGISFTATRGEGEEDRGCGEFGEFDAAEGTPGPIGELSDDVSENSTTPAPLVIKATTPSPEIAIKATTPSPSTAAKQPQFAGEESVSSDANQRSFSGLNAVFSSAVAVCFSGWMMR